MNAQSDPDARYGRSGPGGFPPPPEHGGQHGGQGGYGHAHFDGRPAAPRNGAGVAALATGILAALTFWTVAGGILLGIAALATGIIGFRRSRRGEATNGTMAAIGAVLGALGLIAGAAVLAFGVSVWSSEEFQNLQDCLDNANGQAEIEQCEQDFRDDFGN
ncbi:MULTISPECIES: DUF4190 domain-containing protein [unclassified Streptomyces]|uniref:DUF4190 domain-containing protein n=1 Tax=unclassified Streptomyces TaxID=2593676 RepID=UPI0015E1B4D6|nr:MULTISPECIES: DUF4190 domain-containing protein [unclassified Streptomyces]